MNIFLADKVVNNQVFLSESEAQHITKTLRKASGDTIYVTDGKGNLYNTVIENTDTKRFTALIQHVEKTEMQQSKIHIAIAPTKMNERIEWFIEKAVELGVSSIFFIETKNTQRNKINIERWQKIAQSAAKQSMRLHLPEMYDLVSLKKFNQFKTKNYVGYCGNEFEKIALSKVETQTETLIFIGPEGDFTQEEISFLKLNNTEVISFGNARLRTETAGILAIAAFYQ